MSVAHSTSASTATMRQNCSVPVLCTPRPPLRAAAKRRNRTIGSNPRRRGSFPPAHTVRAIWFRIQAAELVRPHTSTGQGRAQLCGASPVSTCSDCRERFMAWSFKIFTLAGVPVRLHVTFLLLLVWLAALFWMRAGPSAAAEGVLFILLLFGSVVLHEFGHVLAARRYGIATADVTLLPIGGAASIAPPPENPSQEVVIALAGPAVNVAIWLVLMLIADLPTMTAESARLDEPGATLLSRVASANLLLAIFNMIPAFPMDGGRVLRALIATRLGFVRATRIAAGVGQALAVVFAFLGLFGSPLLVLIAIFVFLA